jgi:hypothetical protein
MARKHADPFAEMKKLERSLNVRLAKAPLVTIAGVVSARGPGGSRAQGERQWTFSFDFDGWRVAGGPLRTEQLLVRRKVSERQLDTYQKSIKPHQLLSIRARLLDQPRKDAGLLRGAAADALLVKVLGPERDDAELRRHAALLQQPVTRKDPVLGKLTLNRRFGSYERKAKWNGKAVRVDLSPVEDRARKSKGGGAGDADSLGPAVRAAHALWRDQQKWARRITNFAVKKLLDLYNDTWRVEDEPRLDAAQFARRMKLESVSFNPDGSFAFWHDDGDLFAGHTIMVNGDVKRGPTDADIAG